MDITINRQSVCLGDDMDSHTLQYPLEASSRFSAIFQDLIQSGYFPNIAGNNVVWTLFCGKEDLISWKTKENKLYSCFVTEEPTILSFKRWAAIEINFQYYSPPIKRAKEIFKRFGGSKFLIWHEGFMAEYEAYQVPLSMEEEWRKTL